MTNIIWNVAFYCKIKCSVGIAIISFAAVFTARTAPIGWLQSHKDDCEGDWYCHDYSCIVSGKSVCHSFYSFRLNLNYFNKFETDILIHLFTNVYLVEIVISGGRNFGSVVTLGTLVYGMCLKPKETITGGVKGVGEGVYWVDSF